MKNIIFSVPLFQYQIEDWKLKKSRLKNIYKQSNSIVSNHSYSEIETDYHEQMKTGFKYNQQIEEILNDEINFFKKESGIDSYKVYHSWFELSTKNQFHSIHSHGTIGYSSVCFIDFDESIHSGTVFVSPFNNFITGFDLQYFSNVSEGTILFFPSIIKHYTMPHNSSKERLILSFNLR